MVGFCNHTDLWNTTGVPLKHPVTESPRAVCSGSGAGWRRAQICCPWCILYGSQLDHNPGKVMGRSDNCVTQFCQLPQFLSPLRTGGGSANKGERSWPETALLLFAATALKLPGGRVEVYGRHGWWSRPRRWASFCSFIFCSGIGEVEDIQLVWVLWTVWISAVGSLAGSAEQAPSFVFPRCPSCVTHLKVRAVIFSGFLALQM